MILFWQRNTIINVLFPSICVFFAFFPYAAFAQNLVRTLDPGETFASEIKKGEIHEFQILVPHNHFFFALVERRGVDLEVNLKNAEGDSVYKNPPLYTSSGLDLISHISPAGGLFRIHLEAKNSGNYQLELKNLNPAGTRELSQKLAFDSFQKAARLFDEYDPEQMPLIKNALENSLENWRKAENAVGAAAALQLLGTVLDATGWRREALEVYAEALKAWRDLNIKSETANALDYIAYTSYRMSDFQTALEKANEALELFEEIGDQNRKTGLTMFLGNIYADLGKAEAALGFYEKARGEYLRANNLHRVGGTLNNIGTVYRDLGEEEKALEFFKKSLEVFRLDRPGTRGEANVLNHLGFFYLKRNEPENSLKFFNEALPIWKRITDAFGEPVTLLGIGRVYMLTGDYSKALENFQNSLELARRRGAGSVEASVLLELAKLESRRGDFEQSREAIESAVRIIEDVRASIASREFRAEYFAGRREFYDFYINLLMQMHRREPLKNFTAEAFKMSEKARARSLVELLFEAPLDIRKGADPDLLEKEKDLQTRINAAETDRHRLILWKRPAEQIRKIETKLENLLIEYKNLRAEIRKKSPLYHDLTEGKPLALAEIQREILDDETILIEYFLGAEKSFAWVVSSSDIKSFELPKKSLLESIARRLLESLKTENGAREVSRLSENLSRLILRPLAGELRRKRLLIVPDGALEFVPFAALRAPGFSENFEKVSNSANSRKSLEKIKNSRKPKFLIENHEIVVLSSASALAAARRAKRFSEKRRPEKIIAVIADPVFNRDDSRVEAKSDQTEKSGDRSGGNVGNFLTDLKMSKSEFSAEYRRLPGTVKEARSILALVKPEKSDRFLGFDADRQRILDQKLDQFRILHFATHGIINDRFPDLSSIVLSLVRPDGTPQDGFLRLHEIYNLNLNAEIVVLSACETGLGKHLTGEGVIGLTRGFMYAGAERVLVTLWKVSDLATAELMRRFYVELFRQSSRLTPAQALRRAQISMLAGKRWNSPFFWAAFTIRGEWK